MVLFSGAAITITITIRSTKVPSTCIHNPRLAPAYLLYLVTAWSLASYRRLETTSTSVLCIILYYTGATQYSTHSPTHLLTHLLTYSLTYSLALTYSLTTYHTYHTYHIIFGFWCCFPLPLPTPLSLDRLVPIFYMYFEPHEPLTRVWEVELGSSIDQPPSIHPSIYHIFHLYHHSTPPKLVLSNLLVQLLLLPKSIQYLPSANSMEFLLPTPS